MPRGGPPTYTYTLPPVYLAIPGTTILVDQHNSPLEDIANTFNSAQPVVWGGTGATSVAGAKANLGYLYQSWAAYPTATGTADALVLTPTDALLALSTGVPMTLTGASANTGASTLNVSGTGVKAIRKMGPATDVAVDANDIQVGWRYDLVYDAAANSAAGAWVIINASNVGPYSPEAISGLNLTNDAGDTANDIATSVGTARDGADTANIEQLTALVKRYDAAWAVGTGNGGNFAASATDGLKYIWEIKRPDTGVVDQGFSTSSTDPSADANYPAAYTIRRVIGAFTRTSGVNGIPYWLDGRPQTGSTTPTPTAGSGSLTSASAAIVYTKIGNVVTCEVTVGVVTNGTGASSINVTLPFIHVNTAGAAAVGVGLNFSTGTFLRAYVAASSSTLIINDYLNNYPVASGQSLQLSLTYRT